ncbi:MULTISPECIES: hypothetical protein [Burkholderia]|uniref:hypothetical protein n=1 Tax=Burkholderia TaxID=32008 RepID=UPI00215A4EAE|nr:MULTISPECIES: hypothetical protein [Burkholderia]MCW3675431.1 hypothetical protein [Burkholderia cenocepacia]UVE57659.1 hypothetical protein KU887_19960 [Burkholderia sp. EMB26]
MNTKSKVFIEVIAGRTGHCLSIGDDSGGYRLAGPKPYGGGNVVHRFEVDPDELRRELNNLTKSQS